MTTHLYESQCHDESSVWCGVDYLWTRDDDATNDPAKVTCGLCARLLHEAAMSLPEGLGT